MSHESESDCVLWRQEAGEFCVEVTEPTWPEETEEVLELNQLEDLRSRRATTA
jgi:hypothetical protein